MPQSNNQLHRAKELKNNEFYTFMDDIENELSKYDLAQFESKIVYCNCDDPTWSNFFKFFIKWGQRLKIKEVHFTNYANGKRQFKQLTLFELDDLKESAEDDKKGTAHHWIYTPATNKIVKKELNGNGDFRSNECKEILCKCDIVVTNPPFSLFREFIDLIIVTYNKQFLIIGDINISKYRDCFNLIKTNKFWFGYTQVKKFINNELVKQKFGNKFWYTNLDVKYRHQPFVLHEQDLSQFCRYDNYDAIEVPQVKLIPDNYFEPMGVPITFLQKYCPEQFEILGISEGNAIFELTNRGLSKEFVENYYKNGGTGSYNINHPILGYYNKDGIATIPFSRIIIRRKQNELSN
ncbi:MAG: adenine-specific methyltransferase EcoRI family protein [Christensenellaceae bacterium]|jgi:predicted RNA methylase|nr:adenine-specific methyltransferase EcoRI family protein [Christensenellaceae bacterium]